MDKQAVEVINRGARCVLPESKPVAEIEVDVKAVLEDIVADEDMPEEMRHRVTNFKNRLTARAEKERYQRFEKFISEATSEQLTHIADQLQQTGDPEFDPLIRELYRQAIVRGAGALIERVFPSDTGMTPEKLIEIVSEDLEKQKVPH